MYKSKLQEYCQTKAMNLPLYSTIKEGFDHCPQFKASVIVNGSTYSTSHSFNSSKEAQIQVAKLAYDQLTGSLNGDSKFPVTPASSVVEHPRANETVQVASVGGLNSSKRVDNNLKEMAHLYKNQLQIYAQKRNIPLPVYSCEREGPPHACRFRSKVTLQEKTYDSPEYFFTVKDAENAAAKIALMSLSSDGIKEEDPAVFKNLLQELAQKEYSCLPEYNTTWTGPSHMPVFVSTVEIHKESFAGEEAKTKKLAEMNAAKVAYTALKERQVKEKSEPSSFGSHVKGASHSSSPKLQSIVTVESLQMKSPDPKLSCNKGANQRVTGSASIENIADDRSSQESQCSINGPVGCTNIEPWGDSDTPSSQKIIKAYPRAANITFPPDINVVRENEKWIAVTRKNVQGGQS